MKDFQKLSKAEMKKVRGGQTIVSCFASCDDGSSVACSGGTGTCTSQDGVGCSSSDGGNTAFCPGVIPPLPI
ncbi:MAG: hypothetical protein JSU01_23820 [Bacteroidetes bacterium]|nr:hypothetical protein [Bacteroidota bacterium]